MMHNLIITYDLRAVEQNYEAVIESVKALGSWARVQGSVWYVRSKYSESIAADRVYGCMDRNDSLLVVNASTDNSVWYGLSSEVSEHLKNCWNS